MINVIYVSSFLSPLLNKSHAIDLTYLFTWQSDEFHTHLRFALQHLHCVSDVI